MIGALPNKSPCLIQNYSDLIIQSVPCGFETPNVVFFFPFQFQSYMDSEIRAIMAQYMPLDSQSEVPNHASDDRGHA